MSAVLRRFGWVSSTIGLAVVCFGAASALRADPPGNGGLLDQTRQRNAVAAQQLERDVRDTILRAARMFDIDPVKSVELLRGALSNVEDDTNLSASRRESLSRELKSRIRSTEDIARRGNARTAERLQALSEANSRRNMRDQQQVESDKINGYLSAVRELQRNGRLGDAARSASEAASRYPNNPAVQGTKRTASALDVQNELRAIRDERERRMVALRLDLERSAMPPVGDIEFPKDWAEKTKRRSKNTQLTETEKAIMKSLDMPITIDLKNVKFESFIDYMEKAMGQNLMLDKLGLDLASVSYETPVTVRGNQVTARTILRKVLNELGLSYVVTNQTIQITATEKAKQLLTTRAYYVGDLVAVINVNLPGFLNQQQIVQNIVNIMASVQESIDPGSWASNNEGGLGSMRFDPASMSLIVKASAEIHYALSGGLR